MIHPDFRMIVLANRPGFPFLGNDFFGTLGKNINENNKKNNSNNNNVLVAMLKQVSLNAACAVSSSQPPGESICYLILGKESIKYSEGSTFSGVT